MSEEKFEMMLNLHRKCELDLTLQSRNLLAYWGMQLFFMPRRMYKIIICSIYESVK